MSTLSTSDLLPLRNSRKRIPRLGFGTHETGPQSVQATLTALKAGYRLIDTAQFYRNETEVGQAVAQSGIDRDDVFITTKIMTPAGSPEATYQKVVDSVNKIAGSDGYVDLFLIHSSSSGPAGRKQLWQALERLFHEGRTKSIGVSNYGVQHIEEMKAYAKVWPPDVNQIELHPWCQQRRIERYCKSNGIVVQAYCPLVRGNKANDPTLVGLGKKYKKTTAQVLVRYALQKGWVPLPKSGTPERIIANADVYDFEISKDDMATLDSLDQGDAGAVLEAVIDD
ncbi:hypothetical protein PISL3812_04259 [Talaromyces islandicus]|uniref:D-xylose reductase [NAD(P)H] n=1 Tax=Talaromyces islandicus TaxID=28573 RepID=A0A0U1LVX1_TALIS|nr:hypothetical protein PISL3812_04259 [Talaromyces islandicus]